MNGHYSVRSKTEMAAKRTGIVPNERAFGTCQPIALNREGIRKGQTFKGSSIVFYF